MAQGPSDTILVAIRVTLRIRESKVRNPDPSDCRVRRRFVLSEYIVNNSKHVLYGLSLTSVASQNYNLRHRKHSLQLPSKTHNLMDSNFIQRMLYLDSY